MDEILGSIELMMNPNMLKILDKRLKDVKSEKKIKSMAAFEEFMIKEDVVTKKMNIQNKIRGCYLGWFFGPGSILRKKLTDNYFNIQKNPKYSDVKTFEDIPSDNRLYDQLTQTLIIHDLLVKHGKITPELFKDKLLELNKKDDISNNDQYGPSTRKAVKNILSGKDIFEVGKTGLTSGAAMRCMPIGVHFYKDLPRLIENTYQSCIVTHNTDVGFMGALAVNVMIASLLKGDDKEKSLRETLRILKENHGKYGEPTAFAYVHKRIVYAIELVEGKSFEDVKRIIPEEIGTSWFMIETIPAAFATFFSTKDAKEAALLSFHTGYNHTIPEIACAFHGTKRGYGIFPEKVIKKIERANNFDINKLAAEIIRKI